MPATFHNCPTINNLSNRHLWDVKKEILIRFLLVEMSNDFWLTRIPLFLFSARSYFAQLRIYFLQLRITHFATMKANNEVVVWWYCLQSATWSFFVIDVGSRVVNLCIYWYLYSYPLQSHLEQGKIDSKSPSFLKLHLKCRAISIW